jgi:hypothetical protein
MAVKKQEVQIIVNKIGLKEIKLNLLGTSPLIMNRFAQKAWQELLLPGRRENRAGLEQSLKHDPHAEYRGALYRNRDPKTPTLFHIPNGMVHGALSSAALDLPGATKAKIERLTQVLDVNINLYGTPELYMAMVRNSDINRTPDVRTRPIFPEWACTVNISYVRDSLTEQAVFNLLGAAGLIVGLGDWRPQKGGPFGRFTLVGDDDANLRNVMKQQGRAAQQKAYDNPSCFDEDSEELLAWFDAEVRRREMTGQLDKNTGNGKGKESKDEKKARQLIAKHIVVEGRDGKYIERN